MNAPSLKDQVAAVPTEPGCYLWKDAAGRVLYVGKAKNLRARMRQYVNGDDERATVAVMMSEVQSFDYLVVESEHEALLLEINLIQQYRPPYNVALMDDKSYPYIALTKGDLYPALKYTRERHKPDTRYFGPYTDARAARESIDVVRKICPLCVATCAEWKRVQRQAKSHADEPPEELQALISQGRPCFDFHVGRGPGVCVGAITPEEYAHSVELVEGFLSGKRSELAALLEDEMRGAAATLDFERAARYKRRLEVIQALDASQQVVLPRGVDADIIGIWREETIAGACILAVREGRTVRTCDFILNKGMDTTESEVVRAFIQRYYQETPEVPPTVEVPSLPTDLEAVEGWLAHKRGKSVHVHAPKRGERKHLLDMATRNARHALMRFSMRTGYEDNRANQALFELESALALDGPPMRIECFDISTIHGAHTVASMVVFEGGRPDPKSYRRFKIRTPLTEANDFLSMSEVLRRRYAPERMADERFGKRPDLLIVDGGKPQLTAALNELADLDLDIAVCGLAKSDEELFVPWDTTPVVLPSGSASLYLVKRIRDEAHRFAITYHRELRDKAMTRSILDEVEGLGAVRKKQLMKHFGSMRQIRAATLEELTATPGIPKAVAQNLFETLRAWDKELDHTRADALGSGGEAPDAPEAPAAQDVPAAQDAAPAPSADEKPSASTRSDQPSS